MSGDRPAGTSRLRQSMLGLGAGLVLAAVLSAGCTNATSGKASPARSGSGAAPRSPDVGTSSTSTGPFPSPVRTASSAPSGGDSGSSPATTDTSRTAQTTATTTTGSSGSAWTAINTTPLPFDTPKSDRSASALESRRLAGWVIHPWEVDPSFTAGGGSVSTDAIAEPADLAILFDDEPVVTVLEQQGMVSGFTTGRLADTDDRGRLTIGVFEFSDSAGAATAAERLGAAVRHDKDNAVVMTGHPQAHGRAGQGEDAWGATKYLKVFEPHGTQVVYVSVSTRTDDPADLTKGAGTALDLQAARLTSFEPVPSNELRDQPMDPDRIWTRTLRARGDDRTFPWEGVYTPRGYLHWSFDPVSDEAAMRASGVDRVVRGRGELFRATDVASADALVRALATAVQRRQSGLTDYPAPAGAEAAVCLDDPLSTYYVCLARYGRFVARFVTESPASMAEQVAAQGTLLGTS